MKISFENNDKIIINGKIYLFEKIISDSTYNFYQFNGRHKFALNHIGDKFLVDPYDYIILLNIRKGFEIKSPAFGDLQFERIENGKCIVCKSNNNEFLFNKHGQICWKDEIENVIVYEEDSQCMIFPKDKENWAIEDCLTFKYGDKFLTIC